MEIFDTHAHLYLNDFDNDLDVLISNFREKNIKVILPDLSAKYRRKLIELREKYPDIFFITFGIHPNYVDKNYKEEIKLLKNAIQNYFTKIIGIGECGIDLYRNRNFLNEQIIVLREQIKLAIELNLPLIFHFRNSNSLDIILNLIEEQKEYFIKGVFHCFTGSLDEANFLISKNFFLGINGIITFNNELKNILKSISISNILVETDSPYLSPIPYRGKRNTPLNISIIIEEISKIKNVEPEEVIKVTTLNTKELFKI